MPGRPVAPKDCLRPQPPVAVLSSLEFSLYGYNKMLVVALSIRSHDLPKELNSSSVLITRGDNEVKKIEDSECKVSYNAMNIKYENSIKASVINPAKAIVIEQPKPKAPVYQLTEGTNTLFQDKPHDMLPKTWSCQGQILTPGHYKIFDIAGAK
uniref:Uncharacterized protein n=1 Tax=Oryza glumipatula TaxID=40148 RepID=A0A0D9Z5V1_9ORYZ